MIEAAERRRLLDLARAALSAHVRGLSLPAAGPPHEAARRAGAFVTIHKAGDLRGCIGHVTADQLLDDVVARCAVAAGTGDPRFPAVMRSELPLLQIEISVLGPIERVVSLEAVHIGRHGLMVESGLCRGLLLPQVATEWGWDRETFAAQTCVKAGLTPEAWATGATLWMFDAEVFGE